MSTLQLQMLKKKLKTFVQASRGKLVFVVIITVDRTAKVENNSTKCMWRILIRNQKQCSIMIKLAICLQLQETTLQIPRWLKQILNGLHNRKQQTKEVHSLYQRLGAVCSTDHKSLILKIRVKPKESQCQNINSGLFPRWCGLQVRLIN